jgi:hypothetical protein
MYIFSSTAGVVGRATCSRGCDAFETQRFQFQLFDEGLDDPHQVILGNEIIQTFWQQRYLLAVFAFNESLHESLDPNALIQFRRSTRFHTALYGHRPVCQVDLDVMP